MPGFFPHETVRPVQSNFMEEVKRALHEKKHLIAHCPTGVGKCVSKDTLILTEKGLKPISELYGKPVFVNGLNSSLKMSLAKGLVIRKRKSQLKSAKKTSSSKDLRTCLFLSRIMLNPEYTLEQR
mgnify:CR=1 FL=1